MPIVEARATTTASSMTAYRTNSRNTTKCQRAGAPNGSSCGGVEADHAARAPAGGHVGERGLDVVDADPPCHERLEVEAATASQLRERRDVACRVACPVYAAPD